MDFQVKVTSYRLLLWYRFLVGGDYNWPQIITSFSSISSILYQMVGQYVQVGQPTANFKSFSHGAKSLSVFLHLNIILFMFGPTHGTAEQILVLEWRNGWGQDGSGIDSSTRQKKWLDSQHYNILLIFIPNSGKSNFVELEE